MVLSLVCGKGGVSKSTLALGLSWELQTRGVRVLLVDADTQRTCMEASERAADAGFEPPTTIQKDKDLHRPNQVPLLSKSFDVTVIDTPGKLGEVLRAALAISDVALIPVSPSGPDAWAVRDTVEIVRRAQELRDGLKAALVVTRRIPRSKMGEEAQAQLIELGMPVFTASTFNRTAWAESVTTGRGITSYAPSSVAAEELRSVLDEAIRFHEGRET